MCTLKLAESDKIASWGAFSFTMEFPTILNANLRLIWTECYLWNRWLHCTQTWCDNSLHSTDWFSAIIIFMAGIHFVNNATTINGELHGVEVAWHNAKPGWLPSVLDFCRRNPTSLQGFLKEVLWTAKSMSQHCIWYVSAHLGSFFGTTTPWLSSSTRRTTTPSTTTPGLGEKLIYFWDSMHVLNHLL